MNDLYAFTVPIFTRSLGGLATVLTKTKAHLAAAGGSEEAFLASRLAPDMFPFVRQVQIACDHAKGAAARLAGIEAPKHEDAETTLDALLARIEATRAFLASVPEAAFAGAADRAIALPRLGDKTLSGLEYARAFALPNFFFHYAMAYALARASGVPLGKADYINGLPFSA